MIPVCLTAQFSVYESDFPPRPSPPCVGSEAAGLTHPAGPARSARLAPAHRRFVRRHPARSRGEGWR